jgi:hypothetical protein
MPSRAISDTPYQGGADGDVQKDTQSKVGGGRPWVARGRAVDWDRPRSERLQIRLTSRASYSLKRNCASSSFNRVCSFRSVARRFSRRSRARENGSYQS